MVLDPAIQQIALLVLVGASVGGIFLFLLYSLLYPSQANVRLKSVSGRGSPMSRRAKQEETAITVKDNRRKQVQQSLRQIEERESHRKTLRNLISQAGLSISPAKFWSASCLVGLVSFVISYLGGLPWYLSAMSGFVGLFGLPRWMLGYLRKRREERFLEELPDAIDVMVRGLKAGLPISDALKVIATESGPTVGPEFIEVVEGQRVGITIDQGLERMFDRIPLQEVNFLAIVVSIQTKTGGNLSETLGNLSKVLRDRRKMKNKVRSMSQEGKSSAAIIGAIPFLIMVALTFLTPGYLSPLFETTIGKAILSGCGLWMLAGILLMRKMINFDI